MSAPPNFMQDSSLPDQPNGWAIDALDWTRSITFRQAYERYIIGATLPPEVQYQRHYDSTKAVLMKEGYSEKEVKWWMLRTGQGPACFRQYGFGPCGLPPYDVWFNWYFRLMPDPGTGHCFYIYADRRNNDCYMESVNPIYPPPGYRMPGIPCNTEGKRIDVSQEPWAGTSATNYFYKWLYETGPWPFSDLPEMWGDPNSMSFSKGFGTAFDAVGIIGAGFCSDLEVAESAGLLHPVPRCYTVFFPSSIRG